MERRGSYPHTGLGIMLHYTVICSTAHPRPCHSQHSVVDLRAIDEGHGAEKVDLGQDLLRVLCFSPVSMILLKVYNHSSNIEVSAKALVPTTINSRIEKGPSNLLSHWYRNLGVAKAIIQPYSSRVYICGFLHPRPLYISTK